MSVQLYRTKQMTIVPLLEGAKMNPNYMYLGYTLNNVLTSLIIRIAMV